MRLKEKHRNFHLCSFFLQRSHRPFDTHIAHVVFQIESRRIIFETIRTLVVRRERPLFLRMSGQMFHKSNIILVSETANVALREYDLIP